MLRVRFSEKKDQLITDNVQEYFQMHDKQCVRQFLPAKYNYTIVDEREQADICFCGVQHVDNRLLRDNEINIFLSVENLGCGRTHYKFHNKFGDTGNPKIDVYIHNHFSRFVFDNAISNIDGTPIAYAADYPKVIPTCLFRLRLFEKEAGSFGEATTCPFEDKKFCLFVSQNRLNDNKSFCASALMQIGQVDFITQRQFSYLKDKPCIHGVDLIRLFNQYKFIIGFENSKTPGYITEKIFNVFLAKSIPIYDGAPDIGTFINTRAFIPFDTKCLQRIRMLNVSKDLYERVVSEPKLNMEPNNAILEDYLDHHIENKLSKGYI